MLHQPALMHKFLAGEHRIIVRTSRRFVRPPQVSPGVASSRGINLGRMPARILISVTLLLGCARSRPERVYIISSERSFYTPVVRLAIAVDTTADSIILAIDSGSIRAHGIAQSRGAVMRRVTVEAIAASKPEKTGSSVQLARPWVPLAMSRPVPLVDSLVFNVPVPLQPFVAVIPRPPGTLLSETWLVFRIRGDMVTDEIRMADGRVVPGRDRRDGVQVYACSARSLAGTLDKERARRLATEYASAC